MANTNENKNRIDINKLPKFLIKAAKVNYFLGNNEAIPLEEDYPYLYKLVKERFEEVKKSLQKNYNTLDIADIDSLKKHLSTLYQQVKELEKPIQENLEKICVESVIELFNIPQDSIEFECKLVDKVIPNKLVNVTPQSSEILGYEYEDTDDMDNLQKEVLKRRIIDAMIQGSASILSNCHHLYLSKIFDLDKRLPSLYDEIVSINDWLLFTENVAITDDKLYQGSYVEVNIGREDEVTKVTTQALIFPFLLQETIKGLMELFASHGLPQDMKKTEYIFKQADFIAAEPWDLRIGVKLWEKLINNDEVKASTTPYFFQLLCELDIDDFNYTIKNILSKTKAGKSLFEDLLNQARKYKEQDDFQKNLYSKHEKDIINDGYYANDELDTLLTDDNGYFEEAYFHLKDNMIGCDKDSI